MDQAATEWGNIKAEEVFENHMEPYIVTGIEWVNKILEGTESVSIGNSLSAFVEDWKKSELRTTAGRAMRFVTDESDDRSMAAGNAFLLSNFLELCPHGVLVAPSIQHKAKVGDLLAQMGLSSFVIRGQTMHTTIERHSLWCARVTFSGTRQVCMARAASVKTYMQSKGVAGGEVRTFFKDLREDGVQDMVKTVKVFFATVGPSEFLFVPYGYAMSEQVPDQDVTGLRALVLVPRDKKAVDEITASANQPATPSSNVLKSIAAGLA